MCHFPNINRKKNISLNMPQTIKMENVTCPKYLTGKIEILGTKKHWPEHKQQKIALSPRHKNRKHDPNIKSGNRTQITKIETVTWTQEEEMRYRPKQ